MSLLAFRIAAVYAGLGYLIFFLGLADRIQSLWMGPSLAAAALGLAALLGLEFRRHRPPGVRLAYLGSALFFFLLFSHAFFIPPYVRDDMIYHLLVPKQMALTGRLAFDPFNVTSNFPMLFEMPLAVWESLRIPFSPFLFSVAFAVLFLLVFQAGAARISGLPKAQCLAAALALATTPVLIDLLHSCYVEIFFALLITLAALFYLRTLEREDDRAWLRACVCLGLAAAVKYPGVLFAAFFLAWEFFRGKDRRNFYKGMGLCVAAAAPWYIKNWIWTGNPVFPMANTLFGSPWISAMRFQGFHHMLYDYNMGRAPGDYLLLPFRLALGIDHAGSGSGLGFDGKLSLIFLAALCGLGWKDKGQRFVSVLFICYLAVWALESQQVRFLLAILPLPIAYAMRRAAGLPGRALWLPAIAFIIVGQNACNITQKLRDEKILSLFTGGIDKQAFLSAQMPISYGMARELNGKLDARRDKLMTVGSFGRNYYFDFPVLTNTFYDQEVFRNAFERGNLRPDSVSAFLRNRHVTYVLFNWDFVRRMHSRDADFDVPALQDFLRTSCPPINGHDGSETSGGEPGGEAAGRVVLYKCE